MLRRNPGGRHDSMAGVGVVVGVLLVLGVLAGVLWSQVVTPAEFTKLAKGGAMGEDQLSRQFGADGWYVVLAAGTGLVAGAALSWWRSANALVTSAALVAGAVLAAVAMALTGHLLGPGDPEAALAVAKVGARVPDSLTVGTGPVWPFTDYLQDTLPVYLGWPVGVLAGALLVLVGRAREDDRAPGRPGSDRHAATASKGGKSDKSPGFSR